MPGSARTGSHVTAWSDGHVPFPVLKALMGGNGVSYGLAQLGQGTVTLPLDGSHEVIRAINSRCE